jgi:predicted permease
MGTPLLRGRDFTYRDAIGAPRSVIINESMAQRFWPKEDALGKRFQIAERPPPAVEVIGIVRDSKYFTLWEDPRPYLYLPRAQNYTAWATLHVRTDGDPHDLLGEIRREVQTLDKNMPVYNVATLNDALSLSLFPPRMGAVLLGAFGTLALLLAAIGTYGVMSYTVSRRTHEIGIRMSLGARAGDVLRMTLRECLSLTSIGVGLGIVVALTANRLLSRFLYEVRTTDPLTLIGVCVLLTTIALLACFSPVRRATRVDPIVALRHE